MAVGRLRRSPMARVILLACMMVSATIYQLSPVLAATTTTTTSAASNTTTTATPNSTVITVNTNPTTTANSTASGNSTSTTTSTTSTSSSSSGAAGTCVLDDMQANELSVASEMMRTGSLASFVARKNVAVFAPPDAAATKLLTMMKISDIDATTDLQKAQLQAVMNYHVYPNKWDAAAVFTSGADDTSASLAIRLVDASALPAAVRSSGCMATELNVDLVPGGKAMVVNTPGGYATVASSVPSCNSTIYVSSSILFPCCFSEAMLDITPEMVAIYNSKNTFVTQFASRLRGMFMGVVNYAAVYIPTEGSLSVYLNTILRGKTDDEASAIIDMLAQHHLASPGESADPSATMLAVTGRKTIATALSDNGAEYTCKQQLTISRTTTMDISIKSANGTTGLVQSTYRLCPSVTNTSVVFIQGVLVPCDLFTSTATEKTATDDTSSSSTSSTTSTGLSFGTSLGNLSSLGSFGSSSGAAQLTALPAAVVALVYGLLLMLVL